jgi:hypothetical protein
MANGILKGLAVAAGTGLAMGFTSGRNRVNYSSTPRHASNSASFLPDPEFGAAAVADPSASQASAEKLPDEFPDDDLLDIEPLLDRLERLEARVDSIAQLQTAPGPSAAGATENPSSDYAAAIADLERRVNENSRELELLRRSITEAEGRMTESVASAERRLEQTRAELPALIEPNVTARIDVLRSRFTAEIEQAHQRTLEVFERTISEKISSRIDSIENALAEQAGSIEALGVRAAETDNNLQRLVTAIERLCERAQLIPPASEQFGRTPFESRLNEAMKRDPAVPVVRTEESPQMAPQIPAPAFTMAGSGAQGEQRKSRSFFRNLVVAGFGLLASRFLR